jgi:hypothetical protein
VYRRNFDPRQFAYWLQGAIEIAELEGFTEDHIMMIRRRLNDIPKRDQYASTIWLILAICSPDEAFKAINKIQYDIFVHDIDPTYDADQDFLHDVHDGKVVPG